MHIRNNGHYRSIVVISFICVLIIVSSSLGHGALVQPAPATVTFRLDPARSKFIAHGLRGGLFWFKGHEHLVAARKFSG